MCQCKSGYLWLNGNCDRNTSCPTNSVWNGKDCQCKSDYVMFKGQCQPTVIPLPACPSNSYFNGVFCTCSEGYFEIFPGVCGTCPEGTLWDGNMCRDTAVCRLGYIYDEKKK